MQALRQRVEALRLLVDSREEEGDIAGGKVSSSALVRSSWHHLCKEEEREQHLAGACVAR